MMRRSNWTVGAATAVLVLAVLCTVTGVPIRWSKGTVIGNYCESTDEDYVCLVELVPGGAHVRAMSGTQLARKTSVELRVWVNPFSGKYTYKVVL